MALVPRSLCLRRFAKKKALQPLALVVGKSVAAVRRQLLRSGNEAEV